MLVFTPVLMTVTVSTRGVERAGLLVAVLVALVVLPSATLAAGLLLAATVVLRPWAMVLFGVPAALAASQLDLTYFTDRIDLSGEGNNLSNLVCLQRWQTVEEAWSLSNGLGIGFQQLGVQGTDVPAAQVLRALRDGENMNLLDGSFVRAKLAADFGAIGVARAVCFLLGALRSWFELRRTAHGTCRRPPQAVLVAHASIVSFCIDLFLRGAGYFTGTGLLAFASLWLLAAHRAARRRERRSLARR